MPRLAFGRSGGHDPLRPAESLNHSRSSSLHGFPAPNEIIGKRVRWARKLIGNVRSGVMTGNEGVAMREIVTYIFGLALLGNACLFVPQALAIWRKKSDEGVSLVTFGGFCILQVIGVVHGVYEHDNSLIVGLGASFLTCGTVTLLTIVYRLRRLRGAA
jgi:MtN3 and saliva related transmembrane protein